MSTTAIIRPARISTCRICLNDIVTGELGYGVMDAHYRLSAGETGDITILYEKDHIGRGIEVECGGGEVSLRLPQPNTTRDIGLFYLLIARVCSLLDTEQFELEGEPADLRCVDEYYANDIHTSEGALQFLRKRMAENGDRSFTVFGAMHPISLGQTELDEINGSADKFGELLHRLQAQDVYYAAPTLYQRSGEENAGIFGSYAIGANITSVVPLTPKPFYQRTEADAWYVLLGTDEEDKGFQAVRYEDFIAHLPQSEYYDAEHVVIRLTEDDVHELLARYRTDEI